MEQLIKQIELLRKSIETATDRIDKFYETLNDRLSDLEKLYQKQVITTDALTRSLNESGQNVDDLAQIVTDLNEFVDTVVS